MGGEVDSMIGVINRFLLPAILVFLLGVKPSEAFSLHEKQGGENGPTLLLFGGIQGDEPGGFMAANLLLTHYSITRGRLLLVPNLNFRSIIARSRGVHGDMNRKFAMLGMDDPEYPLILQIKYLINQKAVRGIINLHDGSGFYRKRYLNREHNPHRWGQSTIIDQSRLPGVPYGNLEEIARRVSNHVNNHLLKAEHRFSVKNTHTREGDEEMAKTLTFYAINQGKPAFAVEASKSFGTTYRVYYHLLAVEAYMKEFGIGFERHMALTPEGIEKAIEAQPQIALYDRRVVFDIANARRRLGYVPMKKGGRVLFEASSPLVALVASKNGYQVSYGNNRQTFLHPQYMEYDDSLDGVSIVRNGRETEALFGTIVPVKESVALEVPNGYRVNLIGYTKPGLDNEAGIQVRREDFMSRFSVDRSARLYRAEVYRKERFCGMVLLDFSGRRKEATMQWRANGLAFSRHENTSPPQAESSGAMMRGR